MNPETFHGIGIHVVIALFTSGVPHSGDKKTTFVNFEDDGYNVRQHIGLVDDGRALDRRKHLLEVLNDGVPEDTRFVVRAAVKASDEWQHSYFFFDDQAPAYDELFATVRDYVTWQVDMHARGLGHLLSPSEQTTVTANGDDE
ncbi:hypothetical protein [Clavibacter capsici]|uniref:hypothetical protein n=1 Tax=Clavibacter capsici TaxID=1874630 RepID=UPI00287BB255|nr:hypothetical protein [Clavibacter capsici]